MSEIATSSATAPVRLGDRRWPGFAIIVVTAIACVVALALFGVAAYERETARQELEARISDLESRARARAARGPQAADPQKTGGWFVPGATAPLALAEFQTSLTTIIHGFSATIRSMEPDEQAARAAGPAAAGPTRLAVLIELDVAEQEFPALLNAMETHQPVTVVTGLQVRPAKPQAGATEEADPTQDRLLSVTASVSAYWDREAAR
jgi:Type II secretion system (T2SS), protein M subtype b